jgi:SAM-dependent methyltransferase
MTTRAGLSLRYAVDPAKLGQRCSEHFVQFGPDEALASYLGQAAQRRLGWWMSRWRGMLGRLLSDFDVNALLGAYPMHLLGTDQWRVLCGGRVGGRLLDVGAGSGDVTAALAPLFDHVTTVERSRLAARRLGQRGWVSLFGDVALDGVPSPPYQAIACLNVLDRCPHPAALLDQLIEGLSPGGLLLVAMPLPYSPMFFDGATALEPAERLPCQAESWEEGARALVQQVLLARGLEVTALTRVPYLSGGDAARPFYELDDVVVVCRTSEGEPAGSPWASRRT